MSLPAITMLLLIGLAAGLASGLFGIGGGVLIVPGLIYLAGYSQHAATGTSLAVLLPPVGLAAVLEFYHHGNVDLKAALIIAAGLFIGGWCGAVIANHIAGEYLRLGFGIFMVALGIWLIFEALRRLSWL